MYVCGSYRQSSYVCFIFFRRNELFVWKCVFVCVCVFWRAKNVNKLKMLRFNKYEIAYAIWLSKRSILYYAFNGVALLPTLVVEKRKYTNNITQHQWQRWRELGRDWEKKSSSSTTTAIATVGRMEWTIVIRLTLNTHTHTHIIQLVNRVKSSKKQPLEACDFDLFITMHKHIQTHIL